MTNEEKVWILELRSSGVSYLAISVELKIPESTIRSFCWRQGVSRSTTDSVNACPNCGKRLRADNRRLCSGGCCRMWWNNQDRKRNTLYKGICHECGTEFNSRYKNQKYCSHECYIHHRYGKAGDSNE
ncbi:MAG: hypothetical protein PHY15_05105 [Eubacteriales bacterium]|nr:hypothetical protein [Eubacteriales bacterium]MDD4474473.1 hypothetical protein [Eubacteriales bacterium]